MYREIVKVFNFMPFETSSAKEGKNTESKILHGICRITILKDGGRVERLTSFDIFFKLK